MGRRRGQKEKRSGSFSLNGFQKFVACLSDLEFYSQLPRSRNWRSGLTLQRFLELAVSFEAEETLRKVTRSKCWSCGIGWRCGVVWKRLKQNLWRASHPWSIPSRARRVDRGGIEPTLLVGGLRIAAATRQRPKRRPTQPCQAPTNALKFRPDYSELAPFALESAS